MALTARPAIKRTARACAGRSRRSTARATLADAEAPAAILLRGIAGPIEVKGEVYDGRMPTFHAVLDDEDIALILTHVRGAWSSGADPVAPERVAAVRRTLADDLDRPWEGGVALQEVFDVGAGSDRDEATPARDDEDQEDAP